MTAIIQQIALDTCTSCTEKPLSNLLENETSRYSAIHILFTYCIEEHYKIIAKISEVDSLIQDPLLDTRQLRADVTTPLGVVTLYFQRHLAKDAETTASIRVFITATTQEGSIWEQMLIPDEHLISDSLKPECVAEMNRILAAAESLLSQ
jgi:hypothetical protein